MTLTIFLEVFTLANCSAQESRLKTVEMILRAEESIRAYYKIQKKGGAGELRWIRSQTINDITCLHAICPIWTASSREREWQTLQTSLKTLFQRSRAHIPLGPSNGRFASLPKLGQICPTPVSRIDPKQTLINSREHRLANVASFQIEASPGHSIRFDFWVNTDKTLLSSCHLPPRPPTPLF